MIAVSRVGSNGRLETGCAAEEAREQPSRASKTTIDHSEDVAMSAALSGRHLSGSVESLMAV
jgi:hypothetical protein